MKAIIFDMDGVLVNTEPHHLIIEKRLFEDFGLDISSEEHASYLGKSSLQMWTEIVEKHNLQLKPEALAKKNSDAIINYFSSPEKIDLIPGVKDTLERIYNKGIPMALASSSESSIIDLFIYSASLDKYFLHKVSTQIVGRSKPEPDVYLYTSSLLDVNPAECIVIEDSLNGIKAAKSAGMFCIAYKSDIHNDTDYSIADDLFNDFFRLPDVLGKYLEV